MASKISRSAILQAGITDFELKVAEHSHDVRHWIDHMARVEKDKTMGVPAHEAHAPYPRSRMYPLIEAALNELGIADFTIVEDVVLPTNDDILQERKIALSNLIIAAEQSAIKKIACPMRERFRAQREHDIAASDNELIQSSLDDSKRKIEAVAEKSDRRRKEISDARDSAVIKTWAPKVVQNILGITEANRKAFEQAIQDHAEVDAESNAVHEEVAAIQEAINDRDTFLRSKRSPEDTAFLDERWAMRTKMRAIQKSAAKALHDIADLTSKDIESWKTPSFDDVN